MIENNDKDKNDVNGPDSHLHVYILHEKGHFSKTITIQKKKKKKKWWKIKVSSHFVEFFNFITSFLHVAVELFSLAQV